MPWNKIFSVIVLTSLTLTGQSARVHGAPKPPKSVRIYVFDCGGLKGDPAKAALPVPCYLIAHPKGTLIWDVGLIPDSDLKKGSPAAIWIAPTKSLTEQLASVGYVPEDITYLALSHYHSDHTANANLFAKSTWLVEKADRDVMFSDKKPPRFVDPTQYSALKNSKTTILPDTSDFDVFGDGTVIIKPAPGHTPGHQVLYLKLTKFGPLLVAGDLYTDQEDRTSHRAPNNEQTGASQAKIEEFLKTSGAQIWIEHDPATFAQLKKAPAYYE